MAVLASGVDRPDPSGHRDLIERIAQSGAVVSEIPPGGSLTGWRFIQRSRLLAAISSATVILEPGVRSGVLGVAKQAGNLHRLVGTVPGPITSVTSGNCDRSGVPLCLTGIPTTDLQPICEVEFIVLSEAAACDLRTCERDV